MKFADFSPSYSWVHFGAETRGGAPRRSKMRGGRSGSGRGTGGGPKGKSLLIQPLADPTLIFHLPTGVALVARHLKGYVEQALARLSSTPPIYEPRCPTCVYIFIARRSEGGGSGPFFRHFLGRIGRGCGVWRGGAAQF